MINSRPHPLALRQSRLLLLVIGLMAATLLTALPARAGGDSASPTSPPVRIIVPFYEAALVPVSFREFSRQLRKAESYRTRSVYLIRPTAWDTVSFYTDDLQLGPLQQEATLFSFPRGMLCTTRLDGCSCTLEYEHFLIPTEEDVSPHRSRVYRLSWLLHIGGDYDYYPDSVG